MAPSRLSCLARFRSGPAAVRMDTWPGWHHAHWGNETQLSLILGMMIGMGIGIIFLLRYIAIKFDDLIRIYIVLIMHNQSSADNSDKVKIN